MIAPPLKWPQRRRGSLVAALTKFTAPMAINASGVFYANRAAIRANGISPLHRMSFASIAYTRKIPEFATAMARPKSPLVQRVERLVSGEQGLYVYRDGRYVPESPRSWWEAPDIPCIVVSLQPLI